MDRDTIKNLFLQMALREGWVKEQDKSISSPFTTILSPEEEESYGDFSAQLGEEHPLWDKDDFISPASDYDYRGLFRDSQAQKGSMDTNDGEIHFTDKYKTPYHESFSRESQYATPDAPFWLKNRYLIDQKTGETLFDDKTKKRKKPY